jgi:predicted kinase
MDTIFVNGTVGSGKTTLAGFLSAAEPQPHAVIDLDEIRRLIPSPPDDFFNHELELQNLRDLAANYRAAGARRFVLAGVIQVPAEVPRYVDALRSSGMFICRLVARPDVLQSRLRSRHAPDPDPENLEWHLARAGELAGILERAALDDLVLDSSDASPAELAGTVWRAAGWE